MWREDHPMELIFSYPTRTGLRGHVFKVQSKTRLSRRRQYAFSIQGVQSWNKLQAEINASSVKSLKPLLDAYWLFLFPPPKIHSLCAHDST